MLRAGAQAIARCRGEGRAAARRTRPCRRAAVPRGVRNRRARLDVVHLQTMGRSGTRIRLNGTGNRDLRSPQRRRIPDCSVDGCVEEHYATGLCSFHYRRRAQGRPLGGPRTVAEDDLAVSVRSTPESCLERGCNEPAKVRGLCKRHYGFHAYRGTLDRVALPAHALTAPPDVATCSASGCDRTVRTRGMCRRHYMQLLRRRRAERRHEVAVSAAASDIGLAEG